VDYDPVVLAHARALLVSHEAGAINYVDADLRDTGKILAEASQLLDVGPAGSYLAPTHMGSDLLDEETQDDLEGMQDRMMRRRFTSRTRDRVARFFAGTDLVEPGLVRVEEWRAEPAADATDRSPLWCAVGRKR
jgi:hypothetical protein